MICSVRRRLHLQATTGIIIIGIRTLVNSPRCPHPLPAQPLRVDRIRQSGAMIPHQDTLTVFIYKRVQ